MVVIRRWQRISPICFSPDSPICISPICFSSIRSVFVRWNDKKLGVNCLFTEIVISPNRSNGTKAQIFNHFTDLLFTDLHFTDQNFWHFTDSVNFHSMKKQLMLKKIVFWPNENWPNRWNALKNCVLSFHRIDQMKKSSKF